MKIDERVLYARRAPRGAAMRAAGPPRRAGRRLRVDAGPMQLHPARRMRERREAGRAIQRVRAARDAHHAAQRAHRVLCEHAIDQRAAVALAAMLVRHEYVAPVRERRMIGDETREADEPGIEIRAEAQRSGDHPFAPPHAECPATSTRRRAGMRASRRCPTRPSRSKSAARVSMKRTVELNPNEPLGHYHSSKHCKHSGSQNDGADRLRSVRLYKSTLYFSMD